MEQALKYFSQVLYVLFLNVLVYNNIVEVQHDAYAYEGTYMM